MKNELVACFLILNSKFEIQISSLEIQRADPRARPCRSLPSLTALLREHDDEDQRGQRADADPDPLLLRESGSLKLVQIPGELVKILLRHLPELLVHLLMREAV